MRGESAQHAAGDLVEGLPLAAGLSGPGQWLVDQEDIRRVNFYAGAVPAAVPAPGSIAGVVDSQIRWPRGESQWQVQQSVGSQYFSRSFLRWDSPRLPGASSLFLSGSFTRANLWRSWGEAPAGRKNFALGWEQPYSSGLVRLFYTHGDYQSDNYRPLTWSQTRDLVRYGRFGYDRTPSAALRSILVRTFIPWHCAP